MNAFEVRKYLMTNAKSIMDEADERMSYNRDPLTEEHWEGSKQLFYLKYKTLLDWAGKSNDPLPTIPAPEGDKRRTNADNVQWVIDQMLAGEMGADTAEHILKPTISYMSLLERQQSFKTINEANYMANALRMGELGDMSDEDLKRELLETQARIREEDDEAERAELEDDL